MWNRFAICLLPLALCVAIAPVHAQTQAGPGAAVEEKFPTRPIRLMVGFAPGGGTDIAARIIAPKMGELIGQTVVVENRPGANGDIASAALIRSAPDGYTILLASIGSLAINSHMPGGTPFNPLKDFSFLSLGVYFPNILVVKAESGIKTLQDYIAAGKSNETEVFFGSSGSGSTGHLAGELLKARSGMYAQHVNYKGGGPAMTDLLGGNTDAVVASAPTAVPLVQTGKLTALAVTGAVRARALPDVKTVAEQGFPGFDAVNWYAFVAPPETPRPIVDKLNAAIVGALKDPGTIEKLANVGMETDPSTPEQMAAYVKKQYDLWGDVVKTIKF